MKGIIKPIPVTNEQVAEGMQVIWNSPNHNKLLLGSLKKSREDWIIMTDKVMGYGEFDLSELKQLVVEYEDVVLVVNS